MAKTSLTIESDTRDDFNVLKGTIAESMSADELLRVLMVVYRTQKERVEAK